MPRSWSKGFRDGNAIYKLNMLANATIESVGDRFEVLTGGFDIRTIRVLRLIGDQPGITFAEISTMAALERSLASRLIQKLVRESLVERRNFAHDARRFGLHITEAGQRVRSRADKLSEIGMDVLFETLTPAELAAFIATMDKLANWVDSDAYDEKIEDVFTSVAFDDDA